MADVQQQPPPLWLVAERYFVGSVVGQGGYGMVYRGVDRKTGRAVALKMLSPEAGRDQGAVERMLREQQALVALAGTCAVTAIDLCRLESGAPCLVMEWLEGRDLEQQLSEWEAARRPLDTEQLLAVLGPLTSTLDRAHAVGIVHRDIKPANIFLTAATPGVRLLDFGLARIRSSAPLTAVGMVMGSPSYIAPETWRGDSAQIDGRADLFSLSVIVFRWLTGKLPFDAPDLVGKMMAATSGPRPSAMALNADLHPVVDAWVARALAIDPAARFQSGQDLHDALSLALTGSATAKRPNAVSTKPRALVDAQQILAKALQSAGDLLKRFTQPEAPKSPAPVATKAAPPEMPPAPHKANTVWLDSEELVPVPHKANTVWLDSSELTDVPREALPQAQATPESPSPNAKRISERPRETRKARVTERKRRRKSPGKPSHK
jgi:serine/threonine-protein kinase